jgi:hypothetical protein
MFRLTMQRTTINEKIYPPRINVMFNCPTTQRVASGACALGSGLMRSRLQLLLPLCALQLEQLVALTAQERGALLNLLGIYL